LNSGILSKILWSGGKVSRWVIKGKRRWDLYHTDRKLEVRYIRGELSHNVESH